MVATIPGLVAKWKLKGVFLTSPTFFIRKNVHCLRYGSISVHPGTRDGNGVIISVRSRTVPVVLAHALLTTSYRAYLWSIRACTMT